MLTFAGLPGDTRDRAGRAGQRSDRVRVHARRPRRGRDRDRPARAVRRPAARGPADDRGLSTHPRSTRSCSRATSSRPTASSPTSRRTPAIAGVRGRRADLRGSAPGAVPAARGAATGRRPRGGRPRLAREWGEHAVALRVLSLAVCWLIEVLTEQDKLGLAREIVTGPSMRAWISSPDPSSPGVCRPARSSRAADGRHADARRGPGRASRRSPGRVGYEDRTASWRPLAARALAGTGIPSARRSLPPKSWRCAGPGARRGRSRSRCAAAAMLGDGPAAEERLRGGPRLWSWAARSRSRRCAWPPTSASRNAGQASGRWPARRSPAAADAAVACGAIATAERARRELVALGARPRRLRLRGVDALTPSEHRIAGLAAAGLSNRQIAQELFVSPKTVESHLGQVYGKLGVSGRNGLAAVLDGTAPEAAASTD